MKKETSNWYLDIGDSSFIYESKEKALSDKVKLHQLLTKKKSCTFYNQQLKHEIERIKTRDSVGQIEVASG